MTAPTSTRLIVLSADDDEDAQILLGRAFVKAQMDAVLKQVYDGVEVIAYLNGEGRFSDRSSFPIPNILLLDLKMPRATGFDVLKYLQTQTAFKNLQVVVLSSSNNEADIRRARGLGCHSYVVKPTDFQKLIESVSSIMNGFLSVETAGASANESVQVLDAKNLGSPLSQGASPKLLVMNDKPLSPDSPEIFRFLVEQVKDYAIFMLDPGGNVLSWNEGARRLIGYEAKEIIGKHFSIFFPKPDIDSEKPQFELRMAKDMGRYEEENWRLRKDGSRYWANVVITPLYDKERRLYGYAKVTRDLTQRKLQEESFQRLLESEERFRLLVEQVRDYAIFMLDAKGNITSWNQGARRIKGYSSEEVIGKHFSIFYTPEDLLRDHPSRELSIAIRDGHYEEEGWRVKKDGSRFWANVVITALWDKRGNLSGFAKVTRDLTQRKKDEDLMKHKTEELEAFAHTLSHDLRAPLRSMGGFAKVLKEDSQDLSELERQGYLDRICRSVHSMETLIDGMLKLSQLAIDDIPEEMVSLDAILEQCIGFLESQIKASHAQVKIVRPLPRVLGNPTLLMQVFSNLLANALKFVHPGEAPKVEIFSVAKDGNCEIHVKDSGIGIPEAHQKKVFDLFNRGTAKNDIGGCGIGLAIVKKAMERIGGHVSLTSEEGSGSDFVVTLGCDAAQSDPQLAHH